MEFCCENASHSLFETETETDILLCEAANQKRLPRVVTEDGRPLKEREKSNLAVLPLSPWLRWTLFRHSLSWYSMVYRYSVQIL